MEFMLNLLEDEEVACAVQGHAEILAEETEKLQFAKQHVSRTFHFKTRSTITVFCSNPNIGKHHINREVLMLPTVTRTHQKKRTTVIDFAVRIPLC